MTAPESTTDTQDLIEKVARARWESRCVEVHFGLAWKQASRIFREVYRREATRWLADMEAAGLAVVALPEVVRRERNRLSRDVEVPTADPHDWQVTASHTPGYDEDRIGWGVQGFRSVEQAERDAARVLAVTRWLRAQRQRQAVHDGAGPPICEPRSADCPACAVEHRGGESR